MTLLLAMQVPRVEVEEMGPRLELSLRRMQAAAPDVEQLAMKQPKTTKKKVSLSCSPPDATFGTRGRACGKQQNRGPCTLEFGIA